jgi:hypothetical protein
MTVNISNIRQIAMVEPSPEKAGVGGSIPSLATSLTLLLSTFKSLLFCLCQICVVRFPNQVILEALKFRRPLRIVAANGSLIIGENAGNLLDRPAFP